MAAAFSCCECVSTLKAGELEIGTASAGQLVTDEVLISSPLDIDHRLALSAGPTDSAGRVPAEEHPANAIGFPDDRLAGAILAPSEQNAERAVGRPEITASEVARAGKGGQTSGGLISQGSSSRSVWRTAADLTASIAGIAVGKLWQAPAALNQLDELINFPQPELLRGGRCNRILRSNGAILKNSEGSAATFELSAPVDYLDVFISHNWSTPQRVKFICLAVYFNKFAALVLPLIISGAMCLLTVTGWLPLVHMRISDAEERDEGMWCFLSCYLSILAMLFCWHDIARSFGRGGPSVFLDKVCIHQVDEELKRKGIESLCAYLQYTRTMVVVYSDVYLTKLWTVYEVASFLLLHPHGRMVVLPIDHAKFVLALGAWFSAYRLLRTIAYFSSVQEVLGVSDASRVGYILTASFGLVGTFLMSFSVRRLLQDTAKVRAKVTAFTLDDVTCFKEEDRPIVYGNIATLMRHTKFEENVPQEVALEAFGALAREELPQVLQDSLSLAVLPYHYWVLIFLPWFGFQLDKLAGQILSGVGAVAYVTLLQGAVFTFALWPLFVASFCTLAGFKIHIEGKCNWLINAGATLASVSQQMVLWIIDRTLYGMMQRSLAALVLYVVWSVILLAVTRLVYGSLGRRRRTKHPKLQGSYPADSKPDTVK